MINFLKKLYIILFTKNPYKVVPFNSLIKKNIGEPVGKPETQTYIMIEEEGGLIFYQPEPYIHIQDLKKEQIKSSKFTTGIIYKEATRYLYSLDSGYVIGFLGLVYDKKTRGFIDESAKLWTENLKYSNYTNFYSPSFPKHLPGITLSCITIGADGGFYHLIHEVLPKIFLCRQVLPYVDHIMINGPAAEWKEKWLIHIGIDIKKVIWIDHSSHYSCDQVLFTNRLIGDQHVSNWSINALKELLKLNPQQSVNTKKKIIWITRKNVFDRIIDWEDELLANFPDIEKLDVRNLSVAETINAFANATHVIGPHGAGFSNLIICKPGTKVLELYPETASYIPCFFRISSLCQLIYHVAEVNFHHEIGMQYCKEVLNNYFF